MHGLDQVAFISVQVVTGQPIPTASTRVSSANVAATHGRMWGPPRAESGEVTRDGTLPQRLLVCTPAYCSVPCPGIDRQEASDRHPDCISTGALGIRLSDQRSATTAFNMQLHERFHPLISMQNSAMRGLHAGAALFCMTRAL